MRASTLMVKELREKTGAGIMECKRALEQSGGDLEAAMELLRRWGLAIAEKKAARTATQGLVESYIHAGGRIGVIVELSCETDFVARTAEFKQLAHDIAMQVAATNPRSIGNELAVGVNQPAASGNPGENVPMEDIPLLFQPFIKDPSRTVQQVVSEAIAKVGENIVVRRFARFELGA